MLVVPRNRSSASFEDALYIYRSNLTTDAENGDGDDDPAIRSRRRRDLVDVLVSRTNASGNATETAEETIVQDTARDLLTDLVI